MTTDMGSSHRPPVHAQREYRCPKGNIVFAKGKNIVQAAGLNIVILAAIYPATA